MVNNIKILLIVFIGLIGLGCTTSNQGSYQQSTIKECGWIGEISSYGKVSFIINTNANRHKNGLAYYNSSKLKRIEKNDKEEILFFKSNGSVHKVKSENETCFYQYIDNRISKIVCNNKNIIVDYSNLYQGYLPTCRTYSMSNRFIKQEYCFEESDNMPVTAPGQTMTYSNYRLK